MWARLINLALGIWLMAASSVLRYGEPARTNDYIVGPIAATFAIIAISEATRGVRWVNALLGVWLVLAPWVLGYDSAWLILHSSVIGIAMWIVTAVRGTITQDFGGGWSILWRRDPKRH